MKYTFHPEEGKIEFQTLESDTTLTDGSYAISASPDDKRCYVVSIFNVPMFYVPGNHDPAYKLADSFHAEGGLNLDHEVVYSKGLLMAGLGGSVLYPPGGPNQYTQTDMFMSVYRLMPKIFLARLRHKRRLDLLVTHSPPAGIHDDDDPTHRGLRALNFLIHWARPRYRTEFLHRRRKMRKPRLPVCSTDLVSVMSRSGRWSAIFVRVRSF